jgi:hypothetical protein
LCEETFSSHFYQWRTKYRTPRDLLKGEVLSSLFPIHGTRLGKFCEFAARGNIFKCWWFPGDLFAGDPFPVQEFKHTVYLCTVSTRLITFIQYGIEELTLGCADFFASRQSQFYNWSHYLVHMHKLTNCKLFCMFVRNFCPSLHDILPQLKKNVEYYRYQRFFISFF